MQKDSEGMFLGPRHMKLSTGGKKQEQRHCPSKMSSKIKRPPNKKIKRK